MPLIKKKGTIVFVPKKYKIGSAYESRTIQFFDGRCGTYWEANHVAVDFDEKLIQHVMTRKMNISSSAIMKVFKLVTFPFWAVAFLLTALVVGYNDDRQINYYMD